jgi:hypothetical protein
VIGANGHHATINFVKYYLPPRLCERLVNFLEGGRGCSGVKSQASSKKKLNTSSYHRFLVVRGRNISLATSVCVCGHLRSHHV